MVTGARGSADQGGSGDEKSDPEDSGQGDELDSHVSKTEKSRVCEGEWQCSPAEFAHEL